MFRKRISRRNKTFSNSKCQKQKIIGNVKLFVQSLLQIIETIFRLCKWYKWLHSGTVMKKSPGSSWHDKYNFIHVTKPAPAVRTITCLRQIPILQKMYNKTYLLSTFEEPRTKCTQNGFPQIWGILYKLRNYQLQVKSTESCFVYI